MGDWNFLDPASRKTLLDLVRREASSMFTLLDSDAAWASSTACTGWTAADVVGHLVDTTETYFTSFQAARGQGEPPSAVALTDMAKSVDHASTQFRHIPRDELVTRCRTDLDKMLGILEGLTDEEWAGLAVPHKYMGPLPACFYGIFQLVDYAVHSWDIREGLGAPHALAADAADMLVPLALILWQSTPNVPADSEAFKVGVRVTSGQNAGEHVISVSGQGVGVDVGDVSALPAVLEFDPATLVLTAFGRMNAGSARGDVDLAARFLAGFFRI